MPDAERLGGRMSWRKAIAVALSVGIRPCTGAILVLDLLLQPGGPVAGIFATFAMGLGTAVTVSALASLAVGSRELAVRFAGGGESRLAGAVATGAELFGSTLVFLVGRRSSSRRSTAAGPGPFRGFQERRKLFMGWRLPVFGLLLGLP